MRHAFKAAAIAATVSLALCAAPAHAGRSCEAKPASARTVEKGLTLAERTMRALDAEFERSGAQVVVLARAGQDLSKYGVRYSHLGLAYRTAEGQWLVAHKLNTCGSADASVYRQGLGEFFMDDLFRFEAAWSVPKPEVQAKLYAALAGDASTVAMHTKPYSIVSYVWAQKYQQSNQWAIETMAAALQPGTRNRADAQDWLRANGYEPHVLTIGALTRLGGRMTAANVAFDDHPNEKRFSDRIETVTVDSVFKWLTRTQLGSAPVRVVL